MDRITSLSFGIFGEDSTDKRLRPFVPLAKAGAVESCQTRPHSLPDLLVTTPTTLSLYVIAILSSLSVSHSGFCSRSSSENSSAPSLVDPSSVDPADAKHKDGDNELFPIDPIFEELAAACETQEELDALVSHPDFRYLLSLQELKNVAELPEPILSSLPIQGRHLYPPIHHKPQWRIPVATITFRGYDIERLGLFAHYAVHAASALGIPTSKVYPLPKRRRLWTVLKSPFIFKKAQENFERITHSRGVKAWDAHPDIVSLWTKLLRTHAMPGVGMRVVRWTREEVGGGAAELKQVEKKLKELFKRKADAERVRQLGDKIVEKELAVVS